MEASAQRIPADGLSKSIAPLDHQLPHNGCHRRHKAPIPQITVESRRIVKTAVLIQTDFAPWHALQHVAHIEPEADVFLDGAKTNQVAHVDTSEGIDWGSETRDPLLPPTRQPDQESSVKGFWMHACFLFHPALQKPTVT